MLYPFLFKSKFLIKNFLKKTPMDKYAGEIDTYFNQFSKKYPFLCRTPQVNTSNGSVILINSPLYMAYSLHVESIIGRFIENLGFRVIILTKYENKNISDIIHKQIHGFTEVMYLQDFMSLTLPTQAQEILNKIMSIKTISEIKQVRYKNIPIGLHALASYAGALPTGDVSGNKGFFTQIYNNVKYSLTAADAVERILDKTKPLKVLSVEKSNIGNCELFHEAIHRGIDYVLWASCHEPNSIMLKRYSVKNHRVHPFSVSEKTWQEVVADTNDHREMVYSIFEDGYLNGRWFEYKKLAESKVILSKDEIIKKYGLDSNKKTAIIFSHILDDANLFFGEDIFSNGFSEWLVKTVEAARDNNQVNWLLKLHPANVYRRSFQAYSGEYGEILALKEALGDVPDNIKVVYPDTDINPYSFFKAADYGITVRGTVGAELPCFGIPVLTAGTGRYSNKGFTIDSNSVPEYLQKICDIYNIEPLTEYETALAVKHAYLFFIDRPAKYDSLMTDIFPYPTGHPLFRDINIIDQNVFYNKQFLNITRFIAFSTDEDFLSSRDY
ncbi:hypothetical protein [Candidatus Magnetomonas plexicatena]|uniref:hypothetical protein n=1 Tax=Candidatus Magnetomonas plexicatena TaxID=2552947 RepID=UPI001C75EAF3|nr:hypothetical protein E2O03_012920 [Nitrospirales bacterium LBB_01]